MSLVSLEGVWKTIGDTVVLEDINLAVQSGECFAIVGPSGCGKTMLLRTIAGLERPDRGVIRFDGEDVTRLAPRDRNVAMVFQSYALYPHLRVRGNIGFPLRLLRMAVEQVERRVQETASSFGHGLVHLLDRQPDELSAGHRQRVAVARATVRTPRVFLFDEPSSSLDAHIGASTRLEIRRLLRRLQATAIYVTHDVREAFSLAQRVAVMSPRRIEQVSTPTGLWSRPRNLFVADFVHQGVLNTFPAHMVEEEIALPVARVPAPSSLRARLRGRDRFVLGVRPSQVRLRPPGQGHMNGCVEVVEPLVLEGKQRVHVRGEQFTCVAECAVDLAVTRGDRVGLDLEIEGALLFEHESGQAIY